MTKSRNGISPKRHHRRPLQALISMGILLTVLINFWGLHGPWSSAGSASLGDSQTAILRQQAWKNGNRYPHGPTFLLGIFTVHGEVERRKAVRETYLSFFQDLYSQKQPNRICSFVDVKDGRISQGECQIMYAFVVGGNPDGPTELTAPNASYPMIINGTITDEDDIVYLNIRENMDDGKSQTFFKYASMVSNDLPVDYIGKIDSDTLLFTPEALQFFRENLPRRPNNRLVYGGMPHPATSCNPNVNDTHPCPLELVGDVYMGGSFYFMSPDLAEFTSSDKVPREQLSIRHEDVDVGNFVYTYQQVHKDAPMNSTIHAVDIPRSRVLIHRVFDGNWGYRNRATSLDTMLWAHSLHMYPGPFFKDLRNFRKVWRQYEAFWMSNKTLVTNDIYELYDLPRAPGKHFVRTNDYIYSSQDADASPIVVEKYKVILFPVPGVGSSDLRRLARRLMGFDDWHLKKQQYEGLIFLRDFPQDKASDLMTRPDYTRAMFIREPKLRLLAAYFDHVFEDRGYKFRHICCKSIAHCYKSRVVTFDLFVEAIQDCDEPYWRPQANRMEPKYLPYLNFVGHYESIQEDTKRLLQKLGAWESHGQTGWGRTKDQVIFSNVKYYSNEAIVREFFHPEIEKTVQKLYRADYNAKSLFNLSRKLNLEPAT